MTYFLTRGNDRYGPYTLADLQRYVASGNISPMDIVFREGDATQIQVSDLLSTDAAVTSPTPPLTNSGFAQFDADPRLSHSPFHTEPVPPSGIPAAPALDWWLVLIFATLTCGLFGLIWLFFQARWLKRLDPSSNTILFLALYVGTSVVVFPLAIGSVIFSSGIEEPSETAAVMFGILYMVLGLASMILALASSVSRKSGLETASSPWGGLRIELGAGFTVAVVILCFISLLFIVAPAWIQFHLDRIREWQARAQLGNPGYPYGR